MYHPTCRNTVVLENLDKKDDYTQPLSISRISIYYPQKGVLENLVVLSLNIRIMFNQNNDLEHR